MKVYIKQIEEDFSFFARHFQPIDWSGNNRMQDDCDHSTTKMIQNNFVVIQLLYVTWFGFKFEFENLENRFEFEMRFDIKFDKYTFFFQI